MLPNLSRRYTDQPSTSIPARRQRQRSSADRSSENALWNSCRLDQRRRVASATLLRTNEEDECPQEQPAWPELAAARNVSAADSVASKQMTISPVRDVASQDTADVLPVQESNDLEPCAQGTARSGLPAHARRLFIFRGYQDASSASDSVKSVASTRKWRRWFRLALQDQTLGRPLQLLQKFKSEGFIHIPITDWKTLLHSINHRPYRCFTKSDVLKWRRILFSFTDHVYARIEQPGRGVTESLTQALAHLGAPYKAADVFSSWHAVKGRDPLRAADLVRELLAQKNWAVISKITDDALRTFADLDAFVIETRMLALAKISQPALAVETSEWFKESGTKPSQRALTILFQCHLANYDVVAADEVLGHLAENGWDSGQPFIQGMLKGYRSLGFDEKVEWRVLEDIAAGKSSYTTSIINSLAQLRLDSGDLQGAFALMGYLQIPDHMATKHGSSNDVRIPFPKPKADVATFTILINMACRSGCLQLEQLEAIWRELVAVCSAEVKPDGPALRALVRGLLVCGRTDEATSVVADITAGRNTRWRTGRPRLSAQIFNTLLRHRTGEEGLKGALDVLRMMADARVLPDSTTIRLLSTSFASQAQARPSTMAKFTKRLLQELPFLTPDGRLLDILLQQAVAEETRTYNRVDKRIQATGSVTEPLSSGIIRDLVSPRPVQTADPTVPPFDPVAGIVMGADLQRHYEALFKTAVEVGAKTSAQAFVSRLALDKDRVNKSALTAEDIYAIMLERGIKPSAAHFLQLMQGFVRRASREKRKTCSSRLPRSASSPLFRCGACSSGGTDEPETWTPHWSLLRG